MVRGKLATIGILGNHDYGKNWAEDYVAEQISNLLRDSGVHILRNESIDVRGLTIIGFDDYWGLNFSPQTVMKSYNPNKANLILCHNPDVCDLNIWNDYKGWILSGHTHGGQCKPPFLKPPLLPVKNSAYSRGTVDLET